MSRIGNRKITIPAGVTVTVENNVVTVKGPKGELSNEFNKDLTITVNENVVEISRPNDLKIIKSLITCVHHLKRDDTHNHSLLISP